MGYNSFREGASTGVAIKVGRSDLVWPSLCCLRDTFTTWMALFLYLHARTVEFADRYPQNRGHGSVAGYTYGEDASVASKEVPREHSGPESGVFSAVTEACASLWRDNPQGSCDSLLPGLCGRRRARGGGGQG